MRKHPCIEDAYWNGADEMPPSVSEGALPLGEGAIPVIVGRYPSVEGF